MNSLASRAHPFTGGAVALALIALALVLQTNAETVALYAITVMLTLATGTGVGARRGMIAVIPIWILLFLLQGILGDAPRIAAPWGGTLSEPGLARAISQGSRLAVIATASLAFASAFD
ncbi:MAG: hypothetical protein ABUL71_05230, partial [Gemmatimonadota bacterium]